MAKQRCNKWDARYLAQKEQEEKEGSRRKRKIRQTTPLKRVQVVEH
jgi:hypothetical protein